MGRSLQRLVPATILLFVVGGTFGLLMSYAFETAPFDRAKSIDPQTTPIEVLHQLAESRGLSSEEFRTVSSEDSKSMPVSSGGTGTGSIRTNLGESSWAQLRMEEDYEGPNYIYSWILLRKFSDAIQPRIALTPASARESVRHSVCQPYPGIHLLERLLGWRGDQISHEDPQLGRRSLARECRDT